MPKIDYYTKEERSIYNKKIKALKRRKTRDIGDFSTIDVSKMPIFDLDGDAGYCVSFGCGAKLRPVESLYGNKCLSCLGEKQVDITKFIKPFKYVPRGTS